MAKRQNPLDTDAAKPLDTKPTTDSIADWKADRDRILNEEMPKVSLAIESIKNWSNVVNGTLDLIAKIIPLVTRTTPSEGREYVSGMTERLEELKALACKLTGKCDS